MSAWLAIDAKLGQWAIYALLVLVPVTAILGAWLEGHPLMLLAVGNIQPWLPQSRQPGLALADIRGWLGNALMCSPASTPLPRSTSLLAARHSLSTAICGSASSLS